MFAMSEESDSYETALIDAGYLTPVLAKNRKVFDESGKLPAANLPKIKIEIALFDASEKWVTLEEKNQALLLSKTHDLNDEEVRKALEREFPE